MVPLGVDQLTDLAWSFFRLDFLVRRTEVGVAVSLSFLGRPRGFLAKACS